MCEQEIVPYKQDAEHRDNRDCSFNQGCYLDLEICRRQEKTDVGYGNLHSGKGH